MYIYIYIYISLTLFVSFFSIHKSYTYILEYVSTTFQQQLLHMLAGLALAGIMMICVTTLK